MERGLRTLGGLGLHAAARVPRPFGSRRRLRQFPSPHRGALPSCSNEQLVHRLIKAAEPCAEPIVQWEEHTFEE